MTKHRALVRAPVLDATLGFAQVTSKSPKSNTSHKLKCSSSLLKSANITYHCYVPINSLKPSTPPGSSTTLYRPKRATRCATFLVSNPTKRTRKSYHHQNTQSYSYQIWLRLLNYTPSVPPQKSPNFSSHPQVKNQHPRTWTTAHRARPFHPHYHSPL